MNDTHIVVSYYQTSNSQYVYDSDTKELTRELSRDYVENPSLSGCILDEVKKILKTYNVPTIKALHIGSSTGRIVFNLVNIFENVHFPFEIKMNFHCILIFPRLSAWTSAVCLLISVWKCNPKLRLKRAWILSGKPFKKNAMKKLKTSASNKWRGWQMKSHVVI